MLRSLLTGMNLEAKRQAFKAYDIRGRYPDEVNEELIAHVCKSVAAKVFSKGKVVLGRDGRNSSPSLYAAAKSAIESVEGVEVEEAGLITTPMLTFLVNRLGASGGIIITASHNPKEDNGVKIARSDGMPLSGEEVFKISQ